MTSNPTPESIIEKYKKKWDIPLATKVWWEKMVYEAWKQAQAEAETSLHNKTRKICYDEGKKAGTTEERKRANAIINNAKSIVWGNEFWIEVKELKAQINSEDKSGKKV